MSIDHQSVGRYFLKVQIFQALEKLLLQHFFSNKSFRCGFAIFLYTFISGNLLCLLSNHVQIAHELEKTVVAPTTKHTKIYKNIFCVMQFIILWSKSKPSTKVYSLSTDLAEFFQAIGKASIAHTFF